MVYPGGRRWRLGRSCNLHPDVACDLCGRRLLRGEQPDVFLGRGQRAGRASLHPAALPTRAGGARRRRILARPRSQRSAAGARSLLGQASGSSRAGSPTASCPHAARRSREQAPATEHGQRSGGRPASKASGQTQMSSGRDVTRALHRAATATRCRVRRGGTSSRPTSSRGTRGRCRRAHASANPAAQTRACAGRSKCSTPASTPAALRVSRARWELPACRGEPRPRAQRWRSWWRGSFAGIATRSTSGTRRRERELTAEGLELEELPGEDRIANAAPTSADTLDRSIPDRMRSDDLQRGSQRAEPRALSEAPEHYKDNENVTGDRRPPP